MTPMTPASMPMARSRRGRFSSPDMKLAVCQPPYANMHRRHRRGDGRGRGGAASAADSAPRRRARRARGRATTSIAIARELSSISTVWVLLPARTPRQLMMVRTARVSVARIAVGDPVPRELDEVARERDGDRRHPAALR